LRVLAELTPFASALVGALAASAARLAQASLAADASPRQESNLYLALRRHSFYPLNYGERRQYRGGVT
jgi:hypothetical protein